MGGSLVPGGYAMARGRALSMAGRGQGSHQKRARKEKARQDKHSLSSNSPPLTRHTMPAASPSTFLPKQKEHKDTGQEKVCCEIRIKSAAGHGLLYSALLV